MQAGPPSPSKNGQHVFYQKMFNTLKRIVQKLFSFFFVQQNFNFKFLRVKLQVFQVSGWGAGRKADKRVMQILARRYRISKINKILDKVGIVQ